MKGGPEVLVLWMPEDLTLQWSREGDRWGVPSAVGGGWQPPMFG